MRDLRLAVLKGLLLISMLMSLFACIDSKDGEQANETQTKESVLFDLLSAQHTNVDFQNTLIEGLNTNILMYEYFYNGGGVATADFNNDNLIDIYFTSNMGDNKLYLNRGGFKFEDVTLISKAGGRPGPWKTGVNYVDINGDNKLDIYLCYSGALPPLKRENQLFINQGNDENGIPLFREQSANYKLNSPAFSTQSYFLDYDKDGDLDMLLLNHNPKNLPILNEVQTKELLKIDDELKGLRLFRNDNGQFNDVTTQSNINGSALSYGLGLAVSDFNNDGWDDFYVSNDYSVPDYFYINNGDGTFKNELTSAFGHISQFSMGNDVADLNNDGAFDIVTLDMLPEDNQRQKLLIAPDDYNKFDLNVRSGFYNQYMRNMLQLNNGNGTYSEIGQLAGISNTDWSWSALLADYNNDGLKDLYVTNGYKRDYTNLDFINYMEDYTTRKGRLKREDVMEIIEEMPSSNLSNYIYRLNEDMNFENTTFSWGVGQTANSNGAAFADFDNDGDLDIVVNNINQDAFIYENKSSGSNYLQIQLVGKENNTLGLGAQITVSCANKIFKSIQHTARGYQSAVSPKLHVGLGNITSIDSVQIMWPDMTKQVVLNVSVNSLLVLNEKDATLQNDQKKDNLTSIFSQEKSDFKLETTQDYQRDFDRQALLINELSNVGPCLASGDLNNDGFEDLVIGGESGQETQIYIQTEQRGFQKSASSNFAGDRDYVDTAIEILDVDGDGDNDMYVASGGYDLLSEGDTRLKDRLYINQDGEMILATNRLPMSLSNSSVVKGSDINQDGHLDLFIGSGFIPGKFPESFKSAILLNDGNGHFSNATEDIASELLNHTNVESAIWQDINGDEIDDLLIVGQWTGLMILINENGKLINRSKKYLPQNLTGFWNVIESGDFNNDSKPDFIIGNIGENTQLNPSLEKPLHLYYDDFDENGSIDPILCKYTDDILVPFVARDVLLKQLPYLKSKFPSYDSYAKASIYDVLSNDDIKRAKHLKAETAKTSLLLSTPSGNYARGALPKEVQYAPITAIEVLDYNGDGNDDVILCGNRSDFNLRLGKIDANYGVLLRGFGDGSFKYVNQVKSGLNIRGDVKDIVRIGNDLIVSTANNGIYSYSFKLD